LSHRELTDKKVVCDYLFYRLRSGSSFAWVKLPLVEIKVRSGSVEYGTIGLVDSGSDRTFMQRQEADLLGLKPQMDGDKPLTAKAVGAGGEFDCDIMSLPELQLMKHGRPFCSFRGLSVWVPRTESAIPYAIIGRDTGFRRFQVMFDEGRRRITFTRA
jgi:hypothetical protein